MTLTPTVDFATDPNSSAQPLSGVRVLDFTRFLPGPLAAQFLGDMGAEVIKVEGFPGGDIVRGMEPSIGFHAANRNKKSLHIDFQTARGRDVLSRLIARSDVMIEVSRPGSMAAFGLDYASVRKERPDIVYCSVSAFGQSGPYVSMPSHGMNMDALAGMLPVAEAPDGSPFVSPSHPYLTSLLAAQTTAMGIAAALFRRARTGEGAFIDASCWDAGLAGDPVVSAGALSGVALIEGLASRATPKYAPYRTADGRNLMVCCIEKKFWRGFCERVERPDLIDAFDRPGQDPMDHSGIWGQHETWVYDEVAKAIATRTIAEWEAVFAPSGLPVTPILTREEALTGDHAVARNMVLDAKDAEGRSYRMPASGLVFDGKRAALRIPAPGLGQHTDEILAGLDYSAAEIETLRAERVAG